MSQNETGESKFGCLVFLVVAVAMIYVGIKWGEAQWNYETMKEQITESSKFVASQKNLNLIKVKESIIKRAEETGIDLYEEDIEITVSELYVTIDVYWETPVELPGYTYYLQYSVNKKQRKRY